MPVYSTPPTIDNKDPRYRVTFPDVAMRVARDGPMYGVIILVGVLALRGTTSAMESIIGAAIALLARSHPPPEVEKLGRNVGVAVSVITALLAAHYILACEPKLPTPTPKTISYGIMLEECNRTANTCEESIYCENEARAKYNRPLRNVEEGCK